MAPIGKETMEITHHPSVMLRTTFPHPIHELDNGQFNEWLAKALTLYCLKRGLPTFWEYVCERRGGAGWEQYWVSIETLMDPHA